jgi:TetR/AcrR family transcriptional regulator
MSEFDSDLVGFHSGRPNQTRTRILEAAIRQFAKNGLAGARTEEIAEAAGVNRALLYYYFKSKEKLYTAALEKLSEQITDRNMQLFLSDMSPGEKIVRTALNHFDRLLARRELQTLMDQEMIRLQTGDADAIQILAKRIFAPSITIFQALTREGVASGELINVEQFQIHLAVMGSNVLYFLCSPIWRISLASEAFTQQALAERRKHLVEFWGQTIFVDRVHGAEVAARVLADTPMPESSRKDIPHNKGERKAKSKE